MFLHALFGILRFILLRLVVDVVWGGLGVFFSWGVPNKRDLFFARFIGYTGSNVGADSGFIG